MYHSVAKMQARAKSYLIEAGSGVKVIDDSGDVMDPRCDWVGPG